MTLDSTDKILDFAIEREEEAAEFYTDLAAKMTRANMKEVFSGFAKEELGHKSKLIAVKNGQKLVLSEKTIAGLGIADHVTEQETKDDLSYQEALMVAMNAEKAAFTLYNNLAESCDDAGLRELFLSLAQEEAKHKLRFEIEYDDYVFEEN